MGVSNSTSGNWRASQGSLAEVLGAIDDYCYSADDIVGFAYDSGNSNWVAVYKITKGSE